jgi:sulfite oxidase
MASGLTLNFLITSKGGSIEPFWQMYQIHLKDEILEILEGYRIGNLKKDSSFKEIKSDDPYANEPERLSIFQVNSQKPFNAEPPLDLLAQNFITPNELFFVRNHLPVPIVDPKNFVLEVEGEGLKKIKLTLDDLKKFKEHKVVSTVQCAGNRRSEMNEVKLVKGLNWTGGAIGNAEWFDS